MVKVNSDGMPNQIHFSSLDFLPSTLGLGDVRGLPYLSVLSYPSLASMGQVGSALSFVSPFFVNPGSFLLFCVLML